MPRRDRYHEIVDYIAELEISLLVFNPEIEEIEQWIY